MGRSQSPESKVVRPKSNPRPKKVKRMAIPQGILDALNVVQADSDTLATAQGAAATAQAALDTATANSTAAGAAVASAQKQLATDLAALIAIEQSLYGTVQLRRLTNTDQPKK